MTEEELEQQDKQEQKEEKKELTKRDLKIIITSIVCTLLFIIILLLLVLLGLKKCNKGSSGPQSSSCSSIKYDYDEVKLDDKLKRIVSSYRLGPGGMEPDNILEVEAITYVDNYGSGTFSIFITVLSESNKVFVYSAKDVAYPEDKSRFDNLVSYLLLEDTLDIFLEGDSFDCDEYDKSEEIITTDKECHYVISSDDTIKYIDGYYYQDNKYYVYQHKELTSDPFSEAPNQIIGSDDLLYGYYQSLNI